MPRAHPKKLRASSSVGALPSSGSHVQNAANMMGLSLPPVTLNILARCHESGRLSELINSFGQPAPANQSAMTTNRPTARSYSQPNLLKSRGVSAYAHGVPTPKPVPQPLEAAQYQPPPLKARTRRAAKAARAKAEAATTPPATNGPVSSTTSWGDRAKSTSLPSLLPQSAAQTATSQIVMAPTYFGTTTVPPVAPTLLYDRTRSASLQSVSAALAAPSLATVMTTPLLTNGQHAGPSRTTSTLWGDCTDRTSTSNPLTARSRAIPPPALVIPPAYSTKPTSSSWGDRTKSQSMPALQTREQSQGAAIATSENSGLSCQPASLMERLLPRLSGLASRPKRSSTWVAGNAAAQQTPGTSVSSPLVHNHATPLSSIAEEPPTMQGPRLLPAMELLPERVPTPVEFPEPPPPVVALPEWTFGMNLPQQAPTPATTELEPSQLPPPMVLPDWLTTLATPPPPQVDHDQVSTPEELTTSSTSMTESPLFTPPPAPRRAESPQQQQQQAGTPPTLGELPALAPVFQEEDSATESEESGQEVIIWPGCTLLGSAEWSANRADDTFQELDFDSFFRAGERDAGIAPPTRAEIEMSLSGTELDCSVQPESDVLMVDTQTRELVLHAIGLLDKSWIGFTNLESYDDA